MAGILVDIVIIGRNEGRLLESAIYSCQRAAEEFMSAGNPRPRIIYVDSQSTDNSVELARKMGAECYIVEGKPNPAAGRHLGFEHCTGKYIFFLDGDMEAYPGWLLSGVTYLEEHPEIAGVAGFCDWEVYYGKRVIKIPNHSAIRQHGEKVTTDVGGGFIYRRDVLLEVGDFDPTMVRGEEFALYLRILASGYHSVYLAVPMAIHRDLKGSMGRNFIRKSLLTRNIFLPGVVARKAPRHRASQGMILKRYWLFLMHPLLLMCLIFTVKFAFGSAHSVIWWIISFIIMIQLLIAHWIYKKRNIVRTLISLITINLYIPAFLIGYITGWPAVGGYFKKHLSKEGRNEL